MGKKRFKTSLLALRLEELVQFFENEGFSVSCLPKRDDVPGSVLSVQIEPDFEGRERALLINLCPQVMGEKKSKAKAQFTQLSFVLDLPFALNPQALADLARLLFVLNGTCRFGGFVLEENRQVLAYRYSAIYSERGIEEALMKTIVGNILFPIFLLSDLIEELVSAKNTLQDLISQIQERLKELKELQGAADAKPS